MFSKAVLDGKIIDAFKELSCCKFDKRANMILRCGEDDRPSGIISERTGNVYQVNDWPEFAGGDVAGTVSIEYIDEEEYEALVDALSIEGSVAVPEVDINIPANATVEFIQEARIKEMSAACNTAIINGIDVTLSDGKDYHFSLTIEDQINLISLQSLILNGAESVPYHADGEECRYYSAADIQLIISAATKWKIYQESYFNNLRLYIRELTSISELTAVHYGMTIPDEYVTDVLRMLTQQLEG